MQREPLTENSLEKGIKESLRVLRQGGIVAYPTESFYALGVNITKEKSVQRIYALKKRTSEKLMPLIIGSAELLKSLVKNVSPQAEKLMKKFWPGPLTMVFESRKDLPKLVTGGTGKIAVRIPGISFALELARAADFPITATSANYSGKPPARTAEEVTGLFGENIDLVIEGGQTPGGKPSTILDVSTKPIKVLREGRIRSDQLLSYILQR
jgi:L-threonylcarbamoyladenylate synthase